MAAACSRNAGLVQGVRLRCRFRRAPAAATPGGFSSLTPAATPFVLALSGSAATAAVDRRTRFRPGLVFYAKLCAAPFRSAAVRYGAAGRLPFMIGNRYASALATVLRASALPYGYTVTVWTSGVVLIRHRGLPTTGQAFLFVLRAF